MTSNILTSKHQAARLLYMRTTLDIDHDILLAAKSIAAKQGKSIGRIISDLVRKALVPASSEKVKNGIPLFDVKNSVDLISFDLVNKLRDGEEV